MTRLNLPILILGALFFLPSIALGQNITGTVFRDFNANGTKDNSATFNEPGIGDITVSCIDATGGSGTTTSASDGTYTLSGCTGATRVEFTWSETWLEAGASGNTSVQFVNGTRTGVEFGVNNPADFSQDVVSLNVITPCYLYGYYNDPDIANMDVIVSIPYLSEDDQADWRVQGITPLPHTAEATSAQVGTVYGLAWQRSTKSLYAGAYHRTHSGFGPGGSGAIYVIDRTLPITDPNKAKIYLDINALYGADTAGMDPHPQVSDDNGGNWFNDVRDPSDTSSWVNSWNSVGKIGWGDIEISDDETTIYAVSLAEQKLYEIPADPALAGTLSTGDITKYDIPLNWCVDNTASATTDDSRPFALKYKDGKLYVGITCTAESLNAGAGGKSYDDVAAIVYEFSGGVFSANPVFSFKVVDVNWGQPSNLSQVTQRQWTPWKWGDTGVVGTVDIREREFHQLYFTDIEFDANNDMTLAFRDRWGDQAHFQAGIPTPSSPGRTINDNALATTKGKNLRACWDETSSSWVLESGGICGGVSGWPLTSGSDIIEGPGGNAYYGKASHAQFSMGSLSQVPGEYEIVSTAMGPTALNSGGFLWMNNIGTYAGQSTRTNGNGPTDTPQVGATVYDGVNSTGNGLNKSSGLGDVELLFDIAPLEIGNRVFKDDDMDGEQDPAEAGLDGVTVTLTCGAQTATTTTASGGQYYFKDGQGDIASWTDGIIPRDTACTLSLADTADMAGMTLSFIPNPGSVNDTVDSDGTASGGTVTQSFTTGTSGQNDFSFDFGFALDVACMISATNTMPVCSNAGTPADPSDDTYTFSVTVTDEGGASISWTANDPLGTTGGYGSATSFGPYTISGNGSLDITITDSATGSCQFMIPTIIAPSTCSTGGSTSADLRIEKVASVTSIQSGQQFTYTITITNDGPDTAVGVSVIDLLPSEVTYVSHSSSTGHTNYVSGTGLWTIGDLANGANAILTITVQAN